MSFDAKIGVVFSGGGAKGAYQIGVWKALQNKGIHPFVISGSSIGAFNAALMATTNVYEAEKIWENLTSWRLAKLSSLFPITLLLHALRLMGNPMYYKEKIGARAGLLAGQLFLTVMFVKDMLSAPVFENWFLNLFKILFLIIFYLIHPIADKLNLALLKHVSLDEIVAPIDFKKLYNSGFPIFVTVAPKVPNLSSFWGSLLGGSEQPLMVKSYKRISTRLVTNAEGRSYVPVPLYLKLNDLSAEDSKNCIKATMSLPFGILDSFKIGTDSFVDGGLADNTPIYPLLLEGCERIYVIHLKKDPTEKHFDLSDKIQLRMRLEYIEQLRNLIGEGNEMLRKDLERRFDFVKHLMTISGGSLGERQQQKLSHYFEELPAQIIHIIPSRPLGMPLVGTLFFSKGKTERLINLGYQDTLRVGDCLLDKPKKNE